jgi:Ras-related protein Rab-35
LIVYDVTNTESFSCVRRWIDEINKYCQDNIVKILVGNKDDFDSTGKVVSTDDAKQYARQMNITLFETSAKDNRNIQEAFYALTRLALQQRLNAHKTNPTIDYRNGREIDSQFIQIKPSKKKRHRKSCCK